MLTHFWPGIDRTVSRVEAAARFDGDILLADEDLVVPLAGHPARRVDTTLAGELVMPLRIRDNPVGDRGRLGLSGQRGPETSRNMSTSGSAWADTPGRVGLGRRGSRTPAPPASGECPPGASNGQTGGSLSEPGSAGPLPRRRGPHGMRCPRLRRRLAMVQWTPRLADASRPPRRRFAPGGWRSVDQKGPPSSPKLSVRA